MFWRLQKLVNLNKVDRKVKSQVLNNKIKQLRQWFCIPLSNTYAPSIIPKTMDISFVQMVSDYTFCLYNCMSCIDFAVLSAVYFLPYRETEGKCLDNTWAGWTQLTTKLTWGIVVEEAERCGDEWLEHLTVYTSGTSNAAFVVSQASQITNNKNPWTVKRF